MDIYIALVHHPVHNRLGELVTTAVTNLDIHDLARSARTYDVRGTFIVTPLEQQRSLVRRVVGHWVDGEGASYNPVRAEAFRRLRVTADVDEAVAAVEAETGVRPERVATGARIDHDILDYASARTRIARETGAWLVCFGTGWGLTDAFVSGCELRLPPIRAVPGRDDYNHLSVRSAAAIVLDRLLGDR